MKIVNFCGYEWYVLKEKEDKTLLLAKDIITQKAYHETYKNITWEYCTLRGWLNNGFYKTLKEYHANILDTRTDLGVKDKIFLLSVEEVRKYNIPFLEGEGWWWLRSPGGNSLYAAYVGGGGSVSIGGFCVNYASGGVRPAMWVDTTYEILKSMASEKKCSKITDIQSASEVLRKLKDAQDEAAKNKELAEQEKLRIQNWLDTENRRTDNLISYFKSLLEEYYIEQKSQDPTFRLSTPYGKVHTRKSQKWDYEESKAVACLLEAGHLDFLKHSLRKDEIKKAKDVFTVTEAGKLMTATGEIVAGITVTKVENVIVSTG
ncbi:MAG: host-nuclease inhibitor Gam family protein [Defluviitaleaceae bacterium]|nr:host-nuclease inhibitor Gam family protein [Defluviitaleaceae bacterium]